MLNEEELAFTNFSGLARLFPLPNLVFFPHVDQGLHIFEPRYRQMTADALADDHLIAMVLQLPNATHEPTPIAPVACLGRIVAHEELPDGRYNLRLRGIGRLRILEELPLAPKLYRRVRGQLVGDVIPADLATMTLQRSTLRDAVLARFEPNGIAYRQLEDLFESDTPLHQICDLISYALPLPIDFKQQLLSEPQLLLRVQKLTYALKVPERPHRPFPPKFSEN
jgi:Lon protease-like protein